jgi:hypothetical protein
VLAGIISLAALACLFAFAQADQWEGAQATLAFSATGLAEEFQYKDGKCKTQIAIYDWLSISEGFPLADMPSRNMRYRFAAEGYTCVALELAIAMGQGHIGFEAIRLEGKWQFANTPVAAASCGGLRMDWTPEPVTIVRE